MIITTSPGILWSPPPASPPDAVSEEMHQVVMQWVKSQNPNKCIRWWCNEWNHKIPLNASGGDAMSENTKSQEMHQVVMQWVKTQNPKKCIRWWCTEWDHKIPGDASLGFLWFHWLHRHLMHFLVFVILLVASPLDVPSYMWGCHHPLTNAKVRRNGTMRYRTFR